MTDILIWFFGSIVVLSGLAILITRNVLHAALWLIVCLLGIAALYVILNAVFLGIVQILIYAGGVLVLMAFGIMLTQRPDQSGRLISRHHLWISATITAFAFLVISLLGLKGVPSEVYETISAYDGQVEQLGISFMTEYIVGFELIAFILLVVLVGAAYYARKSDLV